MATLYEDVEEFQKRRTDESFSRIIKRLDSNIRHSLKQTNLQERDDLKQELSFILYEKTISYRLDQVPGFEEFEKSILRKNQKE